MRLWRSFLLCAVLGALPAAHVAAQFGPQYQYFCPGPRSLALEDVDGDGDLDMMVGYREGLSVYINQNGQGQFAAPVTITPNETVGCMMDVDGDGLPDLVGSRELGGGIYMYRNDGDGTFDAGQLIVPGFSANELRYADVDGDGDQDLYFATDDGRLVLCYNANAVGGFATPLVLASLPGLAYVDAVDMDGDLDLDLVYSSTTEEEVHMCANIQGTFDTPQTLTIAGHGVARDLDNDGLVDVLLANAAQGSVFWQRNTGDNGVLGGPQVLDAAFQGPAKVGACDLDGDGDMDAVVTSLVTDEVAWFENTDGHGNYGPRQTVGFDLPGVYAFAGGDVDGDGDADLFVASTDLNKVIWYTSLANAEGRITGRVFNDLNGDGIFNGNDHGLMNVRVEASDVGATYTNASGMYWFSVVPSEYDVWLPPVAGWTLTTPGLYHVVVPENGSAHDNDFGLHADEVLSVLQPTLTSAPLRCGTEISYWAGVANTGNQVSDVRATLLLDPLSTFVWSDPAPTAIVDGHPTWDFPGLQPTHQRSIHVVAHLPGSEHVGEVLHDELRAVALQGGEPLSTHTVHYDPTLLCAIDPNDKVASPVGEGPEHLTAMGQVLTYTVRFQNTGNAEAWHVAIVDTLDSDLDLSTLKVLEASHAQHSLLTHEGVLRFDFADINLPDSASDPMGSQGFVRFSIAPLPGLAEGTVAHNTAAIYFDNNAPVITNTTFNTFSTEAGTVGIAEPVADGRIAVYPNPAQGPVTVHLGGDLQGRVTVDLLDGTGRLVHSITRRSDTVVLAGEGLPDGVYLVRATDERGAVRTARVVFQR